MGEAGGLGAEGAAGVVGALAIVGMAGGVVGSRVYVVRWRVVKE